MSKTVAQLQREAHINSKSHGFWDDDPTGQAESYLVRPYLGNKIALIHGEVSEAHEELRKLRDDYSTYYREDGKPEGVAMELADTVIRIMDLMEYFGFDLQAHIEEKMAFNATRPAMHDKRF